ncbi:hypothetical protein [Streptomyces thermoalcalitolerans]|uniref:Membrane protein n=1 Tax=Streptomyces thermoalcalitolerans TaxID=65605 RepID=A0ABP3YU78_9ACTN
MHMNSVPQHLLDEDRLEYERVLDAALRSAPYRPELTAVGQRLDPEQLRALALGATALITAAAAAEYRHYVKIREELRRSASASLSPTGRSGSAEPDGTGLTATMEGVVESTGAGVGAVITVLTPVLAGVAAVLFLLIGYILKMLDPEQTFAQTMITTGWVFGAITAVAILVATAGLLLTALRNRPSPEPGSHGELAEELAQAREAWHKTLLERGILPFLRDALADAGAAEPARTDSAAPSGRIPQLGYDRPGFSSPQDGVPSPRPSFSSPDFSRPDFTSPDFGGPEHQPE